MADKQKKEQIQKLEQLAAKYGIQASVAPCSMFVSAQNVYTVTSQIELREVGIVISIPDHNGQMRTYVPTPLSASTCIHFVVCRPDEDAQICKLRLARLIAELAIQVSTRPNCNILLRYGLTTDDVDATLHMDPELMQAYECNIRRRPPEPEKITLPTIPLPPVPITSKEEVEEEEEKEEEKSTTEVKEKPQLQPQLQQPPQHQPQRPQQQMAEELILRFGDDGVKKLLTADPKVVLAIIDLGLTITQVQRLQKLLKYEQEIPGTIEFAVKVISLLKPLLEKHGYDYLLEQIERALYR